VTALLLQPLMTVDEFLDWDDGRYELVDGVPRLMAPHSDAHGTIQSNLTALIRNHLAALGGPCRPVVEGGVKPRIRAKYNYRKPDIIVTCTPHVPGDVMVPDPVLMIEILSTNEAETRENITRYISLPSVREIVLFHAETKLAERWQQGADGWSENSDFFEGSINLDTIGLTLNFDEVYRWVNFRT
jgi:Uma2 family endonuclease